MSIQSEIDRISQNVSDSLDAVAAKGATVPTGSTSDDLPSLIASIPTGGAVESVNGQTGVVTLTASDVGALPSSTVVGDPRNIWYGTCSTPATTQTKVINLTTSGFTYTSGNMIRVTFTYQNSATNPILQINGTGYFMYPNYTPQWQDTETVDFVFGADNYWRMVNSGLASTTEYGKTRLSTSYSSTATNMAATPYAVKQAYDLAATKVTAAQASAAAPVQNVNGQIGAVSLTASDVGALPSNTAIPSAAVDIGALPSILDSNYYGTTLPTAGTVGRIFFLKTQ